MEQIRVFIGHDDVENVAFHVLANSIQRHASVPVSITPVRLSQLKGLYTRDRDPKQSNEFSFSRFLVPYLAGYEGWAIFMDCDMIMRTDIKELWDLRDPDKAIQVVKHKYEPSTSNKYLGAVQYPYPKKNWSSVMLMNCAKCRTLTPAYVNNASGLELHQFKWLDPQQGERQIGELPKEWNHLVGEVAPNPDAKLVHYTLGTPCWVDYRDQEFSDDWALERDLMNKWIEPDELKSHG